MKTAKKKTRVSRKAVEKRLHALERRLTEELQEHLGNIHNVSSGQPSELLDIVAEGELDFMSARSAEAGSTTIAEVRQALQKLRQGTYGVCDDCGSDIAPRRLKARPFAVLCLSCKEKEERRGYASSVAPMPVRSGGVNVSLTDDDLHDADSAGSELLRDIEDLEVNEMF
jgi:DnaK suppressor protein